MSRTMTAVRKLAPEQGFVVETMPAPEIGPDEVLVAVEAASICGTDLHIMHWDDWSRRRIKPPLTVGHELAGTVVEVGDSVESVVVGDYISAESHVTCRVCRDCLAGDGHMCLATSILGVDRDGAFADFIALPERVVWRNDRSKLPPEVATLQESFGNAVMATLSHELEGRSVGVMGCGPLGLYSIAVAKAAGAARVLATDLTEYRLALARTMGADDVLDLSDGESDAAEWMVGSNGGVGVDVAMEMSGAPAAIDAAFRATRNGGRVTLIGIPPHPVEIDVADRLIFKNLTVLALSGRRIWETWRQGRDLLESGRVDLRPLITRQMALEEIDEAMSALEAGEAGKIILVPRGGVGAARAVRAS